MWLVVALLCCLQAALSLQLPTLVRQRSHGSDLRMLTDGQEFGPHFDPATGFASIGIIVSYSYMQIRLRQNSQLQENILVLEKELQNAKARQLSGGQEEQLEVARRVRELEDFLRREKESKTFIDLPGLQMNFRVPNRIVDVQKPTATSSIAPTSVPTSPPTVREGGPYGNEEVSEEVYSFNPLVENIDPPPEEASPLAQNALLAVGGVVVLALAYTLVVLNSDPITSSLGAYSVPGDF
jgi:hypothetical protein